MEDVYSNSYSRIKEDRKGISEYVSIYNQDRLHCAINYNTTDKVYYKKKGKMILGVWY